MKWLYLLIGISVSYLLTSIALNGAHPFSILLTSMIIFISLWFTLRYAALASGVYAAPIPELPGEASLIHNARGDLEQANYILQNRLYDCYDDKAALENKIVAQQQMNIPPYAYGYNPNNVQGVINYGATASVHNNNRMEDALDAAKAVGEMGLDAAKAVGGYGLNVAENVVGDVYDIGKGVVNKKLGINNNGKKKKGGRNSHIGKGKGGKYNMGIKNDGKDAKPVGRPKNPPKPKKPKGRPGPKPKNSKGEIMVFDPILNKYVNP